MNLIWDYIFSFYSDKKTYIVAFFLTEFIGIGFLVPTVKYTDGYTLWIIPWAIYLIYHIYLFPAIFNSNFFEPITKWDSYNGLFGKFMRYLTDEKAGRRTLLHYVWILITMWFIIPMVPMD